MGGPLTTDLSPSEYDVFAPFYDAFSAASDYEQWTEQVLELARLHGLAGDDMLDLACGTGNSFMPLLRRGFRITGCDASPAMLSEAAIKAPGARLVQADLRRLPQLGRFDLVACVDDSLNYLLDGEALAAAFRGMAANLATDGVAVFDLNTVRAYRTTFARDSVTDNGGAVFAWRGEAAEDEREGCLASVVIDIFAPLEAGLYERVTTRHEQRHFARAEVARLLGHAGLDCVAVYGVLDSGELVDDADEEAQLKVLYIARHREGGAAA
jgi:SAM-dependent methyltransferase